MIPCFVSGTDIVQFLFVLMSQYSEAGNLKNVSVHFNKPDTLKKATQNKFMIFPWKIHQQFLFSFWAEKNYWNIQTTEAAETQGCHIFYLQICLKLEEENVNASLPHLSQFSHFYSNSMLISNLQLLPVRSVKPESRSSVGKCSFPWVPEAFSDNTLKLCSFPLDWFRSVFNDSSLR